MVNKPDASIYKFFGSSGFCVLSGLFRRQEGPEPISVEEGATV